MSGPAKEYPFEAGCAWISGWDFTVVLDDALAGGPDEELDELRGYLAASEGITEILHEDREVMHLKADDLNPSDVEKKVRKAAERTGIDGYAEKGPSREPLRKRCRSRQLDCSMLTDSPSAWRRTS